MSTQNNRWFHRFFKIILKIYVRLLGISTTVIVGFSIIDAGGMVSYFCEGNNSPTTAYLSKYAICEVLIAFYYILVFGIGVAILLFFVAALVLTLRQIFYPIILRNKKSFAVHITKEQFVLELYTFITGPVFPIAQPPDILLDWKKLYYGIEPVTDIKRANSMKIYKEPFKGLVFRMAEKPDALEISIDTATYDTDQKEYIELLKWLDTLA